MDRAKAANLVNKGNWKTYPAAMLKARAITEVARDACPEALFGVAYTAEELAPDAPVRVEASTEPTESAENRFREACAKAGLSPEAVMAHAGVDQIDAVTLPALRDSFKQLKDAPAGVDAETGEIVDAEIVEERVPVSEAQRKRLMALAGRLSWSKDDRISYGNETLGTAYESWNELSSAEATVLIEQMAELAEFADPEGEK